MEKKWQEAQPTVEQLEGDNAKTAPKETEGSAKVEREPEVDAAITKATSESDMDTITFDEAQALQILPEDQFDNPQQARRAKTVATTAIIKNTPDMTVEAAIRQVIVDINKSDEKFDPTNSSHMSGLRSILATGFDEREWKRNLLKGTSIDHLGRNKETLGQFIQSIDLSDTKRMQTLHNLIAPEQLGDLNKIRDMLGSTEQKK